MNPIERFEKFKKEKLPELESIFKELAKGQWPHTLVISCSDSRIIPELIFSANPGELFVIRNIANIVPPYDSPFSSTISAIEYAVAHLKVKRIIVLGHSQCGGVKAIIEKKADMPHIKQWLSLRENLIEKVENLPSSVKQKEAEVENIKLSVKELQDYPPVKEREAIDIEGWYYDFINQHLTQVV